jgi:hypothetical protein
MGSVTRRNTCREWLTFNIIILGVAVIGPQGNFNENTYFGLRTRLILISCVLEDSVQLERKRQLVTRLSRVVVVDQLQDKIVQPYLTFYSLKSMFKISLNDKYSKTTMVVL